MILLNKLSQSPRFFGILLNLTMFVFLATLLLLGMVEKNIMSEMDHLSQFDKQEWQVNQQQTFPLQMQQHIKNNIETSHLVNSVIAFSFIFLSLSWVITFSHLRRLKNIKAQENEGEQLNQLKEALATNQFVLHYQPIVCATTGNIMDVEALIRWQHPVDGLLSPDKFLPLCEKTGFILSLGEWILDSACKQISQWHEMGLGQCVISINLTTQQLNDPQLLVALKNALAKYRLSADSLKLEITENSLLEDSEKSLKIVQAIHQMGLKLSLDDFGTGYSSLQYLKTLPISNFKIDKLFIHDMTTSITSFGIVESMISLAKSLGISITAEGVENRNQMHILRKMGCDLLQGYLYGKPVSADEFTAMLQSDENTFPVVGQANDKNHYQYEVLQEAQYDQAVKIITQSFCQQNPMIKHLHITAEEFAPIARIMVDKAIRDGLSMVALHNHQVIACALVEDMANPLKINIDMDSRCKMIFNLMENLAADFLNERAMYKGHIAHLLMTGIATEYQGKGLLHKMNDEVIRVAREKNFDFMTGEFTHDDHQINQLNHRRLLMQSCQYKDFVLDGRKPFRELDGAANAYIWEIREGAKLRYKIDHAAM